MEDKAQQEIIWIGKALAYEKRLRILNFLKDPCTHFPRQANGSRLHDGVSTGLIAQKLKISEPTASEHLKILHRARLVTPNRIGTWTFYKRNETAIKDAMLLLKKNV